MQMVVRFGISLLLPAIVLYGQQQSFTLADSLAATQTISNLQNALALYGRICAADTRNYEAYWKFAAASRDYSLLLMQEHADNNKWKNLAESISRKGMESAERAISIKPDGVEGHFYYGTCVGSYAAAVSILRALKEGLKDKTQHSLEKACEIDRAFLDGGPAFALGRYWVSVPWPFKDRKKALRYYQEYLKLNRHNTYWENRWVMVAELYVEIGKEYHGQARRLLTRVVELAKDDFYRNRARELLKKMGKGDNGAHGNQASVD